LLQDVIGASAGCLVIDYNLPGQNGLALLTELRRRGVMLPAILVTTQPSPLVRTGAAAAGAALIEKPFLNEALFEEIRSAVARPPP
jgi:FixJ family two-component response regulator